MQCRGRHKSFVFNIRDACFIMKMKNVKKIDMNKKLYEQIKALLADKLDEKEQKELFHHREFEERMHLQWNMDRQKELDDEVGRKMWKNRNVWIANNRKSMFIYHIGYLWLP